MNNTRIIHTVDAPAGSGKTYKAIQLALQDAAVDQRKTVMVFKSIEMIKQAQRDAHVWAAQKGIKVPIRAIHSETADALNWGYSVSAAILQHLEAAKPNTGEILMISEAALFLLEHWPNRWMWHCICDEVPDLAPEHKVNIPDNHHLLTDHLHLEEERDGYSKVLPSQSGKSVLLRYAENSNADQITEVISKLAGHILSPHFETHIKTEKYRKVCAGHGERGTNQLQFFSLLQPSIFGTNEARGFIDQLGNQQQVKDAFSKVTIMGAGFSESLLGLIWPHGNIEFETHREITDGLRYRQHDTGHRLTLQYLFDTDWSKSFRNKTSLRGGVERSNLSLLMDAVEDAFAGKDFVYLTNKDVQQQVSDVFDPLGGTRLPNTVHGLNMFQHVHRVAILSALNPTPPHVKFFAHMGLQADAVRIALYHSQTYQAVMRCSLRDINATDPVQVILPDRGCAIALSKMIPGSHVEKLDLGIDETPRKLGKPKLAEPKSTKETQRETRLRNRALDKEIQRIQAGGAIDDARLAQFQNECRGDNKRWQKLQQLAAHIK